MKNATYVAAASTLVLVLGCSSSTSSSSGSGGAKGFDCTALRDKQAAANCPKFDGAKYLTDCEATKASVSAACQPKLDALGSCFLDPSVTITCTAAGTVNDETPPACKSADSDLQTCK